MSPTELRKRQVMAIVAEWAHRGGSLRGILRSHKMEATAFWETVERFPEVRALYQDRRGLWAFNAMDGILCEAEARVEKTGSAAWGAILQKQIHAMVQVMEPSLNLPAQSDLELPDALARIEEILERGRARLAQQQAEQAEPSSVIDAEFVKVERPADDGEA